MPSLLVASSGGHLAQLEMLSRRMNLPQPVTWVTFDTVQSRSMLQGRDVRFSPFAGTRDAKGAAKAFAFARRTLSDHRYDVVVSTGASIAFSFLPLAARRGSECFYVESATRLDGPSLTGKLLQLDRRVNLRTQYEHWSSDRWLYRGNVFDGFEPTATDAADVRRVLVSLGMHRDFGFRRLVENLVKVIPDHVEVVWQVGATDVSDLPIQACADMSSHQLARTISDVDVVVTHAGMGSALACLEAGKRPVFVPRRKTHGEHVDDHQVAIATHLDDRKLVAACEAGDITWETLVSSTQWQITRRDDVRFTLA